MKFKALIAGIAGSFVLGSSAMAADIPIIVPPAPPPVVVPVAPAFNWSGAYVGSVFGFGPTIGVQAGYNFVRGNLLFGGSASVAFAPGPVFAVLGSARAGLLLGQRDRLLAYGTSAIQFTPGFPVFGAVGTGLEVKVTDRLSVYAEGLVTVFPVVNCCAILGGVRFQFGG